MKPWFNTSLLFILFVFVIAMGWKFDQRINNIEMLQKINELEQINSHMMKP